MSLDAMVREGQRVTYVGDPRTDIAMGDEGKVLAITGSGAHVQWGTGGSQGQILFVLCDDLAATSAAHHGSEWDDSLDTPITWLPARRIFSSKGPIGVLRNMADEGHLGVLDEIRDEVAQHIVTRLTEDGGFRAVLGQLDPDEAQEVLAVARQLVVDGRDL